MCVTPYPHVPLCFRHLYPTSQEGSLDAYITSLLSSDDPAVCERASLSHVLGWMIDTVTGLWHLHHSGSHAVVHRDLKPPNFLVFRRVAGADGRWV